MGPWKALVRVGVLAPVVTGLWFHWLWAGSCRVEASGQPSGHVLVRLQGSSGGALSWRGTPVPQNLACQPQGLCPNSQQDCQRGLSRPFPPQALSPGGRGVPRRPTSLGHELLSPLLSLDPPGAGRASGSPKWGQPQCSGPGVS